MSSEVKLQYLSNSGFLLTTEERKLIIIDPYLTGNAVSRFVVRLVKTFVHATVT